MSTAALASATADQDALEAAAKAAANGAAPPNDGSEKAKAPPTLWVVDTTAVPGKGSRSHDMITGIHGGRPIIKTYEFEPGKPLELPFPVAIKFLKISEFKRTDKDGNLQPYQRQPKQPHEMGAGEKFELLDHQTVADYKEITSMSLLQRALELPGGESFSVATPRQVLIDFIIKATVAKREANKDKQSKEKAAAAPLEVEDPADIDPVDED